MHGDNQHYIILQPSSPAPQKTSTSIQSAMYQSILNHLKKLLSKTCTMLVLSPNMVYHWEPNKYVFLITFFSLNLKGKLCKKMIILHKK